LPSLLFTIFDIFFRVIHLAYFIPFYLTLFRSCLFIIYILWTLNCKLFRSIFLCFLFDFFISGLLRSISHFLLALF